VTMSVAVPLLGAKLGLALCGSRRTPGAEAVVPTKIAVMRMPAQHGRDHLQGRRSGNQRYRHAAVRSATVRDDCESRARSW
jgi:hypothetical protein